MEIMNSLCCSYDDLKASAEPESELEVQRKQNSRESLTNVSDLTFKFFTKLDCLCRDQYTHKNLIDSG